MEYKNEKYFRYFVGGLILLISAIETAKGIHKLGNYLTKDYQLEIKENYKPWTPKLPESFYFQENHPNFSELEKRKIYI